MEAENILLFFMAMCEACTVVTGDFELGLIHTNDIHSRITQTNKYSASCSQEDAQENKCFGGVARMWTKIKELRGLHANSLLLDAGDQFQGTLWSTHYRGLEASHFMNWLQYDIMTFGNHDFDFGPDILSRFVNNLTFPVVSSNLKVNNSLSEMFSPSHVFNFDGVRVGVVGYLTTELPELVDPSVMVATAVDDEIESVRKEAERLTSEGVNIIIALGHAGYDLDKRLASQVDQVDVVIGAHSHTFLYSGAGPSNDKPLGEYPTLVSRPGRKPALVLQDYAYSKYLGYINVTFSDAGNVLMWNGQPILLDGNIMQDEALLEEEITWGTPLNALVSEILGNTHVHLTGTNKGTGRKCRVQECNIGNMVSDAVLRTYIDGRTPNTEFDNATWTEVAVAVWNSGGVRADREIGQITVGDVLSMLPFRNTVERLEVSGDVLLEMLENSVAGLGPDPSGRYLQMSGLKVTYNIKERVGQRVKDVKVRCSDCKVPVYEPLAKENTYNLLVNTFMANGGDGYTMLANKKISRINIGTLASDAVAHYIKRYSPLLSEEEERIKYLNIQEENGKIYPLTCAATCITTMGTFGFLPLFIIIYI